RPWRSPFRATAASTPRATPEPFVPALTSSIVWRRPRGRPSPRPRRESRRPRDGARRHRGVQGMRAVHPRLPARGPGDVHRRQPDRLPLPRASPWLHRLPGLPRRLPRLLLRRLQVRPPDGSRGGTGAMTKGLMEGSEAMAEAAIACGCRFFAGYPMTPFTELLEHFAAKLPAVGGVCINAESELEAVGMAWGALATGARAATGSTGQGLSLMQESFSEITLAELPLVVFNMARGQSDYFQATRGGGHGDYRHIVLAPMDIAEAVELTQLACHLADRWRNPVLGYGDHRLAHPAE